MESMGLEDHAVVLGCPTLFIHPDPHLGQRIARNIKDPVRIALAAGHPYWRHLDALENALSEIITASDGAFVCSSDITMMRVGRGEFDKLTPDDFRRVREHFYARLSDEDFRDWAEKRGHIFFNVPSWMDFYRQFDFVVGPRIHGTMPAIQAGIPALCIAVDSRTMELCQTMKIPYIMASDIRSGIAKSDLLKFFQFDPDEFDANRRRLAEKFVIFLESNRIKPASSLYNIAGISENA